MKMLSRIPWVTILVTLGLGIFFQDKIGDFLAKHAPAVKDALTPKAQPAATTPTKP
jgi:hypothetical protein